MTGLNSFVSTCIGGNSLEGELRFFNLRDSVIPCNDPWMSSQSDSSLIIAYYDLYAEIWIFEPLAVKKDMGRPVYLKNIEHLK